MDDVFEALRAAAGEVFADQPVTFAYLFGSHARGDARADSDVDVAVRLSDATAPAAYLDLGLRLAGSLRTAPASARSMASSCSTRHRSGWSGACSRTAG